MRSGVGAFGMGARRVRRFLLDFLAVLGFDAVETGFAAGAAEDVSVCDVWAAEAPLDEDAHTSARVTATGSHFLIFGMLSWTRSPRFLLLESNAPESIIANWHGDSS